MQRRDTTPGEINDPKMISPFDKVDIITPINGAQQWYSEISLICSDIVPTLIRHCKIHI